MPKKKATPPRTNRKPGQQREPLPPRPVARPKPRKTGEGHTAPMTAEDLARLFPPGRYAWKPSNPTVRQEDADWAAGEWETHCPLCDSLVRSDHSAPPKTALGRKMLALASSLAWSARTREENIASERAGTGVTARLRAVLRAAEGLDGTPRQDLKFLMNTVAMHARRVQAQGAAPARESARFLDTIEALYGPPKDRAAVKKAFLVACEAWQRPGGKSGTKGWVAPFRALNTALGRGEVRTDDSTIRSLAREVRGQKR